MLQRSTVTPNAFCWGLRSTARSYTSGCWGESRGRGRNQHQNTVRGAPKNHHQNTDQGAQQKSSPEHGSGCSAKIIIRTQIGVFPKNHHPKQSSDPSQNRGIKVLTKYHQLEESAGSSPKIITQNTALCAHQKSSPEQSSGFSPNIIPCNSSGSFPKIITWNSSRSSPKIITQNRALCPPKNHSP